MCSSCFWMNFATDYRARLRTKWKNRKKSCRIRISLSTFFCTTFTQSRPLVKCCANPFSHSNTDTSSQAFTTQKPLLTYPTSRHKDCYFSPCHVWQHGNRSFHWAIWFMKVDETRASFHWKLRCVDHSRPLRMETVEQWKIIETVTWVKFLTDSW